MDGMKLSQFPVGDCGGLFFSYDKKENPDSHSALSRDGPDDICMSVCGIITYEHIRVHICFIR